jgi:hypothetical protein
MEILPFKNIRACCNLIRNPYKQEIEIKSVVISINAHGCDHKFAHDYIISTRFDLLASKFKPLIQHSLYDVSLGMFQTG